MSNPEVLSMSRMLEAGRVLPTHRKRVVRRRPAVGVDVTECRRPRVPLPVSEMRIVQPRTHERACVGESLLQTRLQAIEQQTQVLDPRVVIMRTELVERLP